MADDRYRNSAEYSSHAPPQHHYPSPHGSESRPADQSQGPPQHERHSSMATASVTLPAMHDNRGYGPPPPQGHTYPPPPDPRYESPGSMNGYPPPPGQQQGGYLPPMSQPQQSAYPTPEATGRRQGAPYPPPERQYPAPEQYYYRAPPGQPPHHPQDPYNRDYRGPVFTQEYAQHPPPQMAQAAPRQRTSIACKYCRKRKIRCTGYQSAPGGKCQNCARMGQECVFQPVSSSSSTAFVPVSAVPGGVPPGTQLFGAYGQPLSMPSPQPGPAAHPPPPHPHQQPPPPQHSAYPPPPHGPHQQAPPYYHTGPPPGPGPAPGPYHAPTQSPTGSAYSVSSRNDEGSQSGRRRRRTSTDQDDGYRLPPPHTSGEEDPHRRSPASQDSAPATYPLHPAPKQSPQNNVLPSLGPAATPSGSATSPSPAPALKSEPGSVTPSSQSQPFSQPPGGQQHTPTTTFAGASSYSGPPASKQSSTPELKGANSESAGQGPRATGVMSLSNLLTEKNADIDRGMIDRLNRTPRSS